MEPKNLKIEMLRTSDLKPYPNNPRKNENAVDAVAKSIEAFGFRQPVIVDAEKTIVCGHTRVLAAKRLGLEKVPCIVAADLTPDQIRALRIADNKSAEKAEWDMDLLPIELTALQDVGFNMDALGFDSDELDELLSNGEPEEGKTDADEVPETPEEPVSLPGAVYILGDHRLLCGDSTDASQIQKLMRKDQADLWLTDPPYNVAYEGSDGQKIMNDSMSDKNFREFLRAAFAGAEHFMKPGASGYVFHADSEGYNFRGACLDVGLQIPQCLIWKKNSLVLGRQDYQWIHEPALYVRKPGAPHKWYGDRSQTTVMEFNKPKKNDVHPCLAPDTEVMTIHGYRPIGEIEKGEKVLAADGRFHAVEFVSRHPYGEKIYKIRTAGTNFVDRATHNHPYLVAKRNKDRSLEICWVDAEDVTPGDFLLIPHLEFGKDEPVSELDAYCYGLWLAQGSLQKAGHGCGRYPVFSISAQRLELRKKIVEWADECGCGIYPNGGDSLGVKLVVFDPVKGEECLRICGEYADRKCVAEEVFGWTRKLREAFFTGYIDGDGCLISTRDHLHSKSVSKALASQVKTIAESIGYKVALTWQPAPQGVKIGDRELINTHDFYASDYYHGTRTFEQAPVVYNNVKYWLRRVKAVTAVPYDGEVVNLSVEGSHTFQTANGMTHNTMKPVEMLEYLLGNSTKKGDIVMDTFGGSGSTLIACQRTGRICRTMELDPHYCDVIRKRWAEFVHGEGCDWQTFTPQEEA